MEESLSPQEMQERIKQLEEWLQQSQKMASLGDLLGTTTHEFNNILMTIINYAKMGIRHADAPTRDKAFQKILDSGNKAAKITNSILGMAKNRKKQFDETNIINLLEDALLLLEREMNKYRIQLEKSFEEVPLVYADGNQLQQVLLNLLINARQAMPDGGKLRLKVTYDRENEMVDLIVRDYGTGIPMDKLPHIFDLYYSTKSGPDESGKGGTGLGLALCKKVMELHQGKIRVESTPGKGTAFTLKIPTFEKISKGDQKTVIP